MLKPTKIIEFYYQKNYLEEIKKFKEHYKIETDDTITIVDMYFANEFNKDYIGKSIFDKGE